MCVNKSSYEAGLTNFKSFHKTENERYNRISMILALDGRHTILLRKQFVVETLMRFYKHFLPDSESGCKYHISLVQVFPKVKKKVWFYTSFRTCLIYNFSDINGDSISRDTILCVQYRIRILYISVNTGDGCPFLGYEVLHR